MRSLNRSPDNEYFYWIRGLVCKDRFPSEISFDALLIKLYRTEFTCRIRNDINRANDGIDLRYRFAQIKGYDATKELDGPCSILEMMLALSIRCEENIMDNPDIGDRTSQWFWGMIANLGLGAMYNREYDENYVNEVLERFLNREYDKDGRGGLFTVKNSGRDLRTIEIWVQLCWYLDNIV